MIQQSNLSTNYCCKIIKAIVVFNFVFFISPFHFGVYNHPPILVLVNSRVSSYGGHSTLGLFVPLFCPNRSFEENTSQPTWLK